MSDFPLPRDADDSPRSDLPSTQFSLNQHRVEDVPEYVAILVTDERSRAECTIFPADVREEDVVTTWISAADGSFVSLDRMR